MSIKNKIDKIFTKKTGHTDPDNVMDISKALEALSSDLYTDTKRFIYELLQNADDATENDSKNQIAIRFFDDYLVFAHKGKIFSDRDINGLCGVKYGTKTKDKTKTGYKGIGFKSVFGQSKEVMIYSNKEYFRFDKTYSFGWKNEWGGTQKEWESENDREFTWPWQLIPIYTEEGYVKEEITRFLASENFNVATILKIDKKNEIINEVESLIKNTNMFIFLRSIDKLDFFGTEIIEVNNISNNEIVLKHNSIIKSSWILNKSILELDETIKSEIKTDDNIPEKFKNTQEIELMLCAKKSEKGIHGLTKNESILYSYLPTSININLPVLVNTSFIMSANRQSLHNDSKLNKWIFNQIPQVLISWISELLKAEYGFMAYNLFPDTLDLHPSLNIEFKNGLENALSNTPLLLSHRNRLLKIKDSIYDNVKLYEQTFISKKNLREFILIENNKNPDIKYSPFIIESGYEHKFKKYGLMSFRWTDFSKFISYREFLDNHTIEDNIALIQFIKTAKKDDNIHNETLKNWDFIYNHRNELARPKDLFLPLAGDEYWKDETEISYLHDDIKEFILDNEEYSKWLKNLGLEEKTDKAFFKKNILEKIDSYANEENTFSEMKRFFHMWKEGDILDSDLVELSKVKVLTSKRTLKKVSQCYFSNIFNPELKLEMVFEKDIFLDERYLFNNEEKELIKIFFKKLSVLDTIKQLSEDIRISQIDLRKKYNINSSYFSTNSHETGYSHLPVESYSSFTSLEFLEQIDNYKFSKVFWNYILLTYPLKSMNIIPRGFWGYAGWPGYSSGQSVENYLQWYIRNNNSIPTLDKELKKSTEIFFLNQEMLELCEDYLPIVDIEKVDESWANFFGLKTIVEYKDYLSLYNKMTTDLSERGFIKKKNNVRIQRVIKYFLDNLSFGNESEEKAFYQWFINQKHLSINLECLNIEVLHFTKERDLSVFGDKIEFISFSSENKSHPSFEKFIKLIKVKVLSDNDLKIEKIGNSKVSTLKIEFTNKKSFLVSYLKYVDLNFTEERIKKIEEKLDLIEIYEFEDLQTFSGSINSYFDNDVLNIRKSWKKESVQIELFDKLCNYFNIKGNEKELAFILRADIEDIKEEFEEKGIDIPEYEIVNYDDKESEIKDDNIITSLDEIIEDKKIISSNEDLLSSGIGSLLKLEEAYSQNKISDDFYHKAKSGEYLTYVQGIIEKAKNKILKHLEELDEYDCEDIEFVSDTVFGLKKHDEEFYIVIRPSDNNKVIIYDEAEVDILEHTDSELWHASELNEPDIIRLGKVLKDTGINRIPINDC